MGNLKLRDAITDEEIVEPHIEYAWDTTRTILGWETLLMCDIRKGGKVSCKLEISKNDSEKLRKIVGDRCIASVIYEGQIRLTRGGGPDSCKISYDSNTTGFHPASVSIDALYNKLHSAHGYIYRLPMKIESCDDDSVIFG